MTAQTKATLKARFTSGTEVSAADFGDLIDSFINLAESSAQTVASPVVFNETVTFTTASGTRLQASTLTTSGMVVTGTTSADTTTGTRLADISASSVNVSQLSAGSGYFDEAKELGNKDWGQVFVSATDGAVGKNITISATAAFSLISGSSQAVTTSGRPTNRNFSALANGELKYLGNSTRKFSITAVTTGNVNAGITEGRRMRLGKKNADGSAVTYSVSEFSHRASATIRNWNCIAVLSVAQSSVWGSWVTSDSAGQLYQLYRHQMVMVET